MFGLPKKKTVEVDGKKIELEPKPTITSKLFGSTPKTGGAQPSSKAAPTPPPSAAPYSAPTTFAQAAKQPPPPAPTRPIPQPTSGISYPFKIPTIKPAQPKTPSPGQTTPPAEPKPVRMPSRTPRAAQQGPPSRLRLYIQSIGAKHPDLEPALRKEGIKESIYDFIKRMLILSVIFTVAIGGVGFVVLYKLLHNPLTSALLAVMVAAVVFMTVFRSFLNFPTAKGKSSSKKVERDILFAARDLIIALRSGMPLFNAITSVSSGYGEASKEFLKIVEKVQLGTPLEDAIDDIVTNTKSNSFRKIMLQASVSIRVGADVTAALQSVIDQLTQERVIELRRYGQRLNAIAMFYMLFGVILPSMGIAVLTILTTFIPIFSVNQTILEVVIIGLVFMQVVFLELIRSSRPIFTL
jgi:archaeal flagellar protein FlaJ